MAYRIVAERGNETVRMDRSSSLMAIAKVMIDHFKAEGTPAAIKAA